MRMYIFVSQLRKFSWVITDIRHLSFKLENSDIRNFFNILSRDQVHGNVYWHHSVFNQMSQYMF